MPIRHKSSNSKYLGRGCNKSSILDSQTTIYSGCSALCTQYVVDRVVGQPDIQQFIGAISNKDGKGLFVTTAKFSVKAVECARQNHIILVDGAFLVKLMREHNFGVTVRDTLEIKALNSDIFEEYAELN